jgi:hypothetical protein
MAVLGQSHYVKLSDLPLVVEGYGAERAELDVSSGFRRVTTTVVLRGGGHEGRGEDVTYVAEDHDGFPLDLPLAGAWTIDAFSERIGGLDLFPAGGPTMAGQETYRRWAFESAALDLALRQAGRSLGAALGLEYRPLRFVVSTRLDITPWLAVDPDLEFKLDPTPDWDADRMACVAATGRVKALDFKSFYEGTPVDNPPDPAQYAAVVREFPDAVLEDPALEGPARLALNGHERRFSFDAPIHSWADVEDVAARAGLWGPPRFLNIKPSRFGSLRALLDCVARAQVEGIVVYGGGQFELGVGRDHIQALASLLYAGAPNDVAPRDFHGEPRPAVPGSPLVPLEQRPGLGFAFAR